MTRVFISYRQMDDAQRQRVRAFAEKLRACGIDVVLDQFFLEANPAGPNDGWPKWSSDQAIQTERVLIIGNEAWFQCFENKQPPGTGLGAACEASDLRQRIYNASGVNGDIRVVLFDDADAQHISFHLERYHRFHAQNNFDAIVQWLGGTLPTPKAGPSSGRPAHTTIPHNLPRLQPFFGREEELEAIKNALDPESRTWGVLIDGPGGMGKTSLAVRAAYDCPPELFQRIIFVSIKDREMDDDGERKLGNLLVPGFLEMLNEIARELGHTDIPKSAEDQRSRLVLDALRGTQTLLILDNLESLTKDDRDRLFNVVNRLPQGCKAILTSRRRIGSGSVELILEKLSQEAALDTLAEMAKRNTLLAKTSEAERIALYTQTGGKPLLLRWTAGQMGRGSCRTFTDAIIFLRSCPADNDPLEFIFGDLAKEFSKEEEQVLCALTYFSLPTKVEHIAVVADLKEPPAENALRSLANRSLVTPDEEERCFALVPLVGDFLRSHHPRVVAETGDRLEKRSYALIVENGYDKYDRFPVLDAAWPTVAPALPLLLTGANERLQTACAALQHFLDFTGRWDERLSLSVQAESRAMTFGDHDKAGWRASDAGWVHNLRGESKEVLEAATRAVRYWEIAQAGTRERAIAIRLIGLGHKLNRNYPVAIAAYREALQLLRSQSSESSDVARAVNNLAGVERLSGELEASERDSREAIRLFRAAGDQHGIASAIGNLALLMLHTEDWKQAETLAWEALPLAEKVGRLELVASISDILAEALVRQDRAEEALSHARRAVEIFTRLCSPNLQSATERLRECEDASKAGQHP